MATPVPDFEAGVQYWEHTSADVNGVLGGYGESTPVPRLDATSSRLLILSLLPQLSTIPPPHRSSSSPTTPATTRPSRPFRALDCGAGIGRVTSTVLLPLFDLVDLVEPVPSFVKQAKKNALRGGEGWRSLRAEEDEAAQAGGEKQAGKRKAVRIWKAGLQHFDPRCPGRPVDAAKGSVELFAKVGREEPSWPAANEEPRELAVQEEGYDLVMIQWCIGHLSDDELVAFLQRSRAALRQQPDGGPCEGYIVLKENVCQDEAERIFDEDDSSFTRSDKVFREIFERAGLTLYRREVQQGFPAELFPVIAYALR
ncbi:hypothetical protein JCM10908_004273 [Rhodotorula pacifica]|uniref:N-terminal protein methyltransferase n=1 Tax=Rhodotorula pacifica TaxID=1495444 RepID=UPI00317FEC79